MHSLLTHHLATLVPQVAENEDNEDSHPAVVPLLHDAMRLPAKLVAVGRKVLG